MSDQPYPPSAEAEFQVWKRDIERRLRNLETSSGMVNTSVRGGSTTWVSRDDGLPIAVFGVFGDGVSFFEGFVMYDGDGRAAFMTRSDKPGIVHPEFPAPFHHYNIPLAITSGTFVAALVCPLGRISHEGVRIVFSAAADAATVGEVRMREVNSGAVSNPVTITAGTAGQVTFRWEHGKQIDTTARFEVQARRVSGAGNVNIYEPIDAAFVSSALEAISPTGNGTYP